MGGPHDDGQALLERRRAEHRKTNWRSLMENDGEVSATETPLSFLIERECVLCGASAAVPETLDRPLCGECKKRQLKEQERDDRVLLRLEQMHLLAGEAAHMTMEAFVRETPMQKRAYEVVRLWWNDWAAQVRLARRSGYMDSVLLWSRTPGTGKTHLARAVQRKLIEVGSYPCFRSVAQLTSELRDSYGKESVSDHRIISDLIGRELLLLDDLGKEYVSEKSQGWFREIMWKIIDGRHKAQRPIFVTSNLSPEGIVNLIGPYAASRYHEMVDTRICDMSGEDWRMRI